ncbi:ABC transporter substrate-binding protein [Neorhizobium galegae]|uniref:ABC transporter substrate-binding protein n=1 Tax=Neorhizobium galegae TaxID=399 RepID=UPI00062147B6|nr:ABC transporter substrate-binding protein [Neorhizobium galegae]KAB1125052.1 ABC transporter substrate-binding protein [Neorhizobium galegae]MCQ1809917.1 ABC transporter substrate-binding protein [Neorhizobium galegae]CDZ61380.1 ABC-type proline/glycine betaine transport system, periplasmic component [Neorhizobium galegae bv. orientalis]
MKKILASTVFAAGLYAFAGSASADCGTVSIAEMNWASAGIAANLDKIILEQGFGCTVQLVPGDTLPTFTSMNERGQPDLAPEFWINSVRTTLDKAVADGRMIVGAEILSDGAVEGWWIPKFLADAHPDIKTVQQALTHPDLFPAPQKPGRGAVYNCPSGWSCQVSSANLFKALGAEEKKFELIDTGTAAGLDGSITNAFEKKTGWLGYYWAPTAFLGKYEMVKLSFNVPHDKADWDACTAVPNCPNPKVNSYPTSQAFTLVTKQFAQKAEVAMDYIKRRKWTNTTVNSVLAWQEANKSTNEVAAKHFLETSPDIWTKWVAPDVADKIKASL